MANHKSAIKRAKQNEIKRIRNKASKTRIKSIVKEVRTAASEESRDNAVKALNSAKSIIATSAKKGVLHKSTAARKISRLSKLVNSISA